MMANMDTLIMSGASNRSAGRTEYAAVKKETHRQFAIELKRRIVEETFAPGESVSIVARRHDVNANMVFAWRQKYYRGEFGQGATKVSSASPEFIPVGMVMPSAPTRPPLALPASTRRK